MADDQPWSVLESHYVRKDRWIGLREDRCLTADGVEVAPYYVLEYPDWVHVVALDDQERVLLVRQYRHGAGEFTLELPAGKIDPADADALQAAARELLEETGCVARSARLIGVSSPNPATHANHVHTVLCTGVEQVQAPLDDPMERISSRWEPIDRVLAMVGSGEITTAIQIASLLTALLATGRLTLTGRRSAAAG